MLLNELKDITTIHESKYNEDSDSWKSSKFYPKKVDDDADPFKVAYNNMLQAAIKNAPFPSQIKSSLLKMFVGGNSVFDSVHEFMSDFEEAQHDGWIYESTLEEHYKNIVKIGESFADIASKAEAGEKTLAAWMKNITTTTTHADFLDFVKIVNKIRLPIVKFEASNADTIDQLEYSVTPHEIILMIDGKEKQEYEIYQKTKDKAQKIVLAIWDEFVDKTGLFNILNDDITITVKVGNAKACSEKDFKLFETYED